MPNPFSADYLGLSPDRVKVGVTDVDGVLRTKTLSWAKVQGALAGGFGFCDVIFSWDIHDRLYTDYTPDPAFGDLRATLRPETGRTIPWEDNLPLILADFGDENHPLSAACPRSLLRSVVERAAELGFEARFGPEYEWFLYRESPASLAARNYQNPTPHTPGQFGYSGLRTAQATNLNRELFTQLAAFDVPLEGLHTETGPGVYEAALDHQPALEAADRAVLFKQGVREIAYRHDRLASFMAKPSADLPGCGGHLHQSLWRDGKNAFHDPAAEHGMSDLLRSYVAGQLHWLPRLLPLYAPTVNSYKRYVPGSWAPLRANWGVDCRTAALRVIPGSDNAQRLETRIAGADANPYLAIAAALASGLYGIEHGMTLDLEPVVIEAEAAVTGEPLPTNLGEATERMTTKDVLPPAFLRHFRATRREEWNLYQRAVTDWERRRYFELA